MGLGNHTRTPDTQRRGGAPANKERTTPLPLRVSQVVGTLRRVYLTKKRRQDSVLGPIRAEV